MGRFCVEIQSRRWRLTEYTNLNWFDPRHWGRAGKSLKLRSVSVSVSRHKSPIHKWNPQNFEWNRLIRTEDDLLQLLSRELFQLEHLRRHRDWILSLDCAIEHISDIYKLISFANFTSSSSWWTAKASTTQAHNRHWQTTCSIILKALVDRGTSGLFISGLITAAFVSFCEICTKCL